MKLLILTQQFPNRRDPQRGIYNLQQTTALSRYCEVGVVAPTQWFPYHVYEGLGPSRLPRRDKCEGLTVWHPTCLMTPVVGRNTHPVQMAATLFPAMARIRREYPFDALFALWAFPDVVAGAMFARLWRVPLLAAVLGSDINVLAEYPLRRRQIRWALDRAHRVLAVSGALRSRLRELDLAPEHKIMVHHNGVDRTRFCPADRAAARARLGLPSDGKHVLFVGFLQPAKSVHTLVRAAAYLKERGELGFTTHLVGDGPDAEELRRLAAELGVAEAVRFHGGREHREIPAWMAAADVFCLPSIREGCPNVILEALASGRPVVASRVGGIPELTSDANSLLVPPSQPEALGQALRTAVEKTWDAQALAASVDCFDWDTSARAIYEAAREAVEVNGSMSS